MIEPEVLNYLKLTLNRDLDELRISSNYKKTLKEVRESPLYAEYSDEKRKEHDTIEETINLIVTVTEERIESTKVLIKSHDKDGKGWQDRLLNESLALLEKTGKLKAFIESPEFGELEAEDRKLLKQQHGCMCQYSNILIQRIQKYK